MASNRSSRSYTPEHFILPGSWPVPSPPTLSADALPESLRAGLSRLNLTDPPNTPITPSRPVSPGSPAIAPQAGPPSRTLPPRPQQPSTLRRSTRPPTLKQTPPQSPLTPRASPQTSPRSPHSPRAQRVAKRVSLSRPSFHKKSSSGPSAISRAFELSVREQPRRAISARDAGAFPTNTTIHRASAVREKLILGHRTKMSDSIRRSGSAMGGRVVGFQAHADGSEAMDESKDDESEWVEETEWLDAPMPGLSERPRVQRTLRKKRLDELKFVDFGHRSLPRTPLSMSITPRELYHSNQQGVYTPPGTNEHSPISPVAPSSSHLPRAAPSRPPRPDRPALLPISANTAGKAKGSPDAPFAAYPLTPIAMDLASLSVIAGLPEVGSLSVEPGHETPPPPYSNPIEHSRTSRSSSSSTGTTRIRLRTGSVVTVTPPEQTAWKRRVYLAGPIRLSKDSDEYDMRGRLESIVNIDHLLESVEAANVGKRKNSEDQVLDELVDYFSSFGFEGLDSEMDHYWSIGGEAPPSPPPEMAIAAIPMPPEGHASMQTGLLAAAANRESVTGSMDSEVMGGYSTTPPLPLPSPTEMTRQKQSRQRLGAGLSSGKLGLKRLMKSAGSVI